MLTIKATRPVFGPTRYFQKPGLAFVLVVGTCVQPQLIKLLGEASALLTMMGKHFNQRDLLLGSGSDCVTMLTEIFAGFAMALQHATDAEVEHLAITKGAIEGESIVCLETEHFEVAAYAGELAACTLNSLIRGEPDAGQFFSSTLPEFLDYVSHRTLDPNTRLLMAEARRRRFLVLDIDQAPFTPTRTNFTIRHGLIQIGMGCRQRRFLGPLAEGLDPNVLAQVSRLDRLMPLLRRANIPIPDQDLEFTNNVTAARVRRAGQRVGFPVMLRSPQTPEFSYAIPGLPQIGPIITPSQLQAAYECAFAEHHPAWVESYVAGSRYSFLIIGNTVESVLLQHPPQVIGDGITSMRSLVAMRLSHASSLQERLAWKEIAAPAKDVTCMLALAGLDWDSIPDAGRSVCLRVMGTPYNGGHCEDVSHALSAAFEDIAVAAARASDLDFAGVEMVIGDPQSAAIYPNCAVTNVYADPDMSMHVAPGHNPAVRLLKHFYPMDSDACIPTVAVTGTNGKTTTTRMLAHIFRQAGYRVGYTCTLGIYIDGEMIAAGDMSGSPGSHMLLADRTINAAILETARGGLIKYGRPFDQCDIGICLNVEADHIGFDGIHTLDEMAVVKRQVIENTSSTIVLNADDPRCLAMISHSSAKDVLLFSGDPDTPDLELHGRAVVIEKDQSRQYLAIRDGLRVQRVISVDDIPAVDAGRARYNLNNAAAAAAAAYAIGIPISAIKLGLQSFESDFESNPGRFNDFMGLPFRLILDSAHNPHGVQALMQRLAHDSCDGRRIVVFSAPIDSTEASINESTRLIAGSFDYFICTKRKNIDDASINEKPLTLRATLIEYGVTEDRIDVIFSPVEAIDTALEMACPGDLVMILISPSDQGVFDIGKRLHQYAHVSTTPDG